MSSYIYFYIKPNENQYILVDYFSRSNKIYGYARNYAEWEKLKPLSEESICYIIDNIHKDIKSTKEYIAKQNKLIDGIRAMNNSINEKLEAIRDYQETIEDAEEEIEQLNYTEDFFLTLSSIYNCNQRKEPWIYIGIEIPLEAINNNE